jgi:phosphoglycolate phosphatase-like HAD superfamily hydrolase
MITTLFLDFDGVILESVEAKTEAFFKMYLPYGEEFANRVRDFHLANGGVSRFDKFRTWHQIWLQENLSEEKICELSEKFSRLCLQNVIESPYVPGALQFLKKAQFQYQMFVITGSAQKDIDITLEKLKINSLFLKVCGSPRNKIEWGTKLMLDYQLKPDEILFVGDSESDKEAAKFLKTHFVLRETELNRNWSKTCQYVLPDLRFLLELIETICENK